MQKIFHLVKLTLVLQNRPEKLNIGHIKIISHTQMNNRSCYYLILHFYFSDLCLSSDAVSRSDHTASNDKIISKLVTGKDVKWSSGDPL